MERPIVDSSLARTPPLNADRVYRVPPRFGIGSIILLTALFCALFGILRYYQAHPASYILSIAYFFAVGGAQVFWGEFPRGVSIGAGAILMPLAALIAIYSNDNRIRMPEILCILPASVLVGAFFGYLAGALLAGFFLLSEMFDQQLGLTARRSEAMEAQIVDEPAAQRSSHVAAFVERRQQHRQDLGLSGRESE